MPFGPIVVTYDGHVLEPRPWTLAQAEWAAELSVDVPAGPILELCCGAGHIGLAAARLTGRDIVQVDVDGRACALARTNAARNALAAHVEVRQGQLDAAVGAGERFPLILADPPYVPTGQVDHFRDDPVLAIDGGRDGLDVVERCLRVAADHLVEGGAMVLQLRGPEQVAAGTDLAAAAGLAVIGSRHLGRDRGLLALASLPAV